MFILISMTIKYTKELLEKTVSESSSMVDLIRRLGSRYSGGLHGHLKSKIKSWNIDDSHFSRKGVNKGKKPINKLSWKEVLVKNRIGNVREYTDRLRNALIESGVPYLCDRCGQEPMWKGTPLVIQIDHIDGDGFNNLRENLRFLCPNCHTQTETFGTRNIDINYD